MSSGSLLLMRDGVCPQQRCRIRAGRVYFCRKVNRGWAYNQKMGTYLDWSWENLLNVRSLLVASPPSEFIWCGDAASSRTLQKPPVFCGLHAPSFQKFALKPACIYSIGGLPSAPSSPVVRAACLKRFGFGRVGGRTL